VIASIPFAFVLCVLIPGICSAQAPGGTIAGTVHDQSGAVISGVPVQALSRATGQARTTVTTERGDYSFPALLAGEYEVSVEASGFERIVRTATVEAGTTTTANFALEVGEVSESVTVTAASPQIHHDSASVGGLVTRSQVEGVPLNGRGFLELAKLEPGVQTPAPSNRNRTVVPVLGAPSSIIAGARFTIDGGSVTSLAFAGAELGLSQEAVQEIQVSTVNFDLSAGMTDTGAINVVTRSGSNDLRGTAFYFFRDHTLAAYPALNRDPANPDPFFQRQQFGFALGGPIRRNRVFYFANWERNDQRSVAATTLLAPDFAHFSRITASPSPGDLFSVRVDGRISDAHTAFVRFSRDGSGTFAPPTTLGGGSPNAYPSAWIRASTSADQSLLGLTSVIHPTLVNDLRFSYFSIKYGTSAARADDCPGCVGMGAPAISIPQVDVTIGNSASNDLLDGRFQFKDGVTWQRRPSRARRRGLGAQPPPESRPEQRAGYFHAVLARPSPSLQPEGASRLENSTAGRVQHLGRYSAASSPKHDGGHRRPGRATGRWNSSSKLEHAVAIRPGHLADARAADAELRTGLGLRRHSQSRPQQACLARSDSRRRRHWAHPKQLDEFLPSGRAGVDAFV
jgi:hypothetical protein